MADNAIVGILRALLTLDTAEFEKGSRKGQDSAKALSKEFTKFGKDAEALGKTLTATLTLPLVGLAAGAAKLAIDFESSFAGVRKTVNATEPELQQLAMGFRELARTIPVNVNELNRLGEAAGALGIPKEEIIDFSRVMAMLGVTTNVTADQAAESIAQIQTQFNSAGKETENFASALVHLGNNGASTEAQILELTSRLASAGNAAGMSQADVLGFAAAMANVGINAEAGGTALSRTFNEINAAVARGGDDLEKFARIAGKSSADFAKLFREDAASAVEQFILGLGRVQKEGGNLVTTLDELGIKEIRQSDTLRRLALNTDNVTKALSDARLGWRENTALSEEAGKRFETVESQLTLLWNRIKDVGITLGNALMPAIKGVIGVVDTMLPLVDMLAKGFAAMPAPIQMTVIGFGAAAAAAGPLLFVAGQLSQSLGSLVGAFGNGGIAAGQFGAALSTLKGALATAGAGLAGWGLGTLIRELADTDRLIDNIINQTDRLKQSRLEAGGASATLASLLQVETDAMKKLDEAYASDNQSMIAQAEVKAKAIRDDSTRLAMIDTIRVAVARGAKETITYAEATQFLSDINEKNIASQKKKIDVEKTSAETTARLTKETEDLRDELSGAKLQGDVEKLHRAFMALTPEQRANQDVMRRVAEAADALHKEGAKLTPELHTVALRFHAIGTEAPKVQGGIAGLAQDLPDLTAKFRASNEAIFQASESMRTIQIALDNARTVQTLPFDFANWTMPLPAETVDQWMADINAAIANAKPLDELFADGFLQNLKVDLPIIADGFIQIGDAIGNKFVSSAGAAIQKAIELQRVMAATSSSWAAVIPFIGVAVVAAQAWNAATEGWAEKTGAFANEFSRLAGELQALGGEVDLSDLTLGVEHWDENAEAIRRMRAEVDRLNAVRKEAERIQSLAESLGLGLGDKSLDVLTADLPKAFDALFKNLNDLTKEGFDFNKVLEAQSGQWLELVNLAEAFGLEVPASMRPVLDQLAKMGLLIDEASQKKIGALKEQLGALDRELTSLRDFVANEAPEEVMGVMEMQARERIAQLENEKANIEQQIDELSNKLNTTFTEAAETGYQVFADQFGQGIHIPIYWELEAFPRPVPVPGSGSSGLELPEWEIPNLNEGTHGMFPDWGNEGTIVRLHDREGVVPYDERGRMGGGSDAALRAEVMGLRQDMRNDRLLLPTLIADAVKQQRGRA